MPLSMFNPFQQKINRAPLTSSLRPLPSASSPLARIRPSNLSPLSVIKAALSISHYLSPVRDMHVVNSPHFARYLAGQRKGGGEMHKTLVISNDAIL